MRTDRASVLAVALVATAGLTAQAQYLNKDLNEGQPPIQSANPGQSPGQASLRGPGGAIGGFHLIMMPAVQQELRMDEAQQGKARAVADRMNARYIQDMKKLEGLNADEKAKRAVNLAGPHYEEGMRELRGFLSPQQVDRFDQILFQMRGPMAMLDPQVAPTLRITQAQAKQVAELFVKARQDQQAAAQAAGNDRQAGMKKLDEIADRANREVNALLSPEQRQAWKRFTGEPFRPTAADTNAPAPGQAPPASARPAPRR